MSTWLRTVLLLAPLFASSPLFAQGVLWQRTYGTSGFAIETSETSDGGLIVVGISIASPRSSMHIVKTDALGAVQWEKSYGGTNPIGADNAFAMDVVQTDDGGYVIAGGRQSQPVLLKISSTGDSLWSYRYGMDAQGNGTGTSVAIARTADAGFVVTGNVFRSGMNASRLHLFKVNASGGLLWAKTFGSSTNPSIGEAVRTTSDGGLIVSGSFGQTASTGTLKSSADAYLVKTDADGTLQWEKTYPGIRNEFDDDIARDVRQTSDGGFILAGQRSTGSTRYETDILVMKTDATGNESWTKTFGGSGNDGAMAATPTADGGYAVIGWQSTTADDAGRTMSVMKLGSNGDEQWTQTLDPGYGRAILIARDGNIVVAGVASSKASLAKLELAQPQYFVFSDAKGGPIANHDITLYEGSMNPGLDRLVATVRTDDAGRIMVDPSWYDRGDNVRAVATIATQNTLKQFHESVGDVAYRIILDNVGFDERTSLPLTDPVFTTYDDESTLAITLDHATVLLSLMISVEWDADDAYMNEIERGMKYAANYLYDVTDGQVALENVIVVDRKLFWKGADVLFLASTEMRPNAAIEGFLTNRSGTSNQVMMPRRWFGTFEDGRDLSAVDEWLTVWPNDTWRTLAHELGHQFLGFYDEYIDIVGNPIAPGYNLGYMDSHYSELLLTAMDSPYPSLIDERYATELSSAARYRTGDRSSRQFVRGSGDCWTSFESRYERWYGGVYCPIIKPSERQLPTGAQHLLGPNNESFSAARYDASTLMALTVINASTEAVRWNLTLVLRASDGSETPAAGFVVSLLKNGGPVIEQGKMGAEGALGVLGGEVGETIKAAGSIDGKIYSYAGTVTGRTRGDEGTGLHAAADAIEVRQVDGEYRLVPSAAYLADGRLDLRIAVDEAFTQDPRLTLELDGTNRIDRSLARSAGAYQTTLDSLPGFGSAMVTGFDRSRVDFPMFLWWSTSTFASEIFSGNGGARLALDSANVSASTYTWISSAAPTAIAGLDPDTERGGDVHALALRGASTLSGTNGLTIAYADSDVKLRSEQSLRIFRWNDATLAWEKIGGTVDTLRNEVTAAFASPGTYAAFTTTETSSIERERSGRGTLGLTSTVGRGSCAIEFTLPRREHVSVEVYNGMGALVATLLDDVRAAGPQSFVWNATGVASGVYYAVVATAHERSAVSMAFVR